jgi:hypothetical protein
MQLPIFKDPNNNLVMMQNKWKSILDPIIALPQNDSNILKNVSLSKGTNTINHKLGQTLQGWKVVRQRASASIYDNQDSNTMPALTLILVSSDPVVVDIEVF